jgi:prolyl-tRNA editing enzyme YbaK/EbsC (Cys-tRNA(Pro) deacylase)
MREREKIQEVLSAETGNEMSQGMVLDRIRVFLDDSAVPYREAHHGPTRTSEEAAEARGESIRIGGKAIVAKVDKSFSLFVLSAALALNSRAICRHLKAQRFRFARREELMELTGLVPGCVPPFGRPILDLDLYVDRSIMENDRIAFNAGSLTDSVIMDRGDYVRIARPKEVFRFSR